MLVVEAKFEAGFTENRPVGYLQQRLPGLLLFDSALLAGGK